MFTNYWMHSCGAIHVYIFLKLQHLDMLISVYDTSSIYTCKRVRMLSKWCKQTFNLFDFIYTKYYKAHMTLQIVW